MASMIEMVEAHLANVQREIGNLNERKVAIDNEIGRLNEYLKVGIAELEGAKSKASAPAAPAEPQSQPTATTEAVQPTFKF